LPVPTLHDISLRPFTAEDAPAVQEWFSNPDATGDLMDEAREDFTLEDARAWVERAMKTDGNDRKWAIVMAGEPRPVGFTALYGLNGSTPPELGCVLGANPRDQRGGEEGGDEPGLEARGHVEEPPEPRRRADRLGDVGGLARGVPGRHGRPRPVMTP
jgi:hypothetical protein